MREPSGEASVLWRMFERAYATSVTPESEHVERVGEAS
jgi:hypothetical protein